jgi:ribonuclease inhibitor
VKEYLQNEEIKKFDIDLSSCKYMSEIYKTIKNQIDVPEYCGENLDALWDCLTGFMYVPAEITIRPCHQKDLTVHMQRIIDIFKDVEKEYDEIIVHVVN